MNFINANGVYVLYQTPFAFMKKDSFLEVSNTITCITCPRPIKINVIKRKTNTPKHCYACGMLAKGVNTIRHFRKDKSTGQRVFKKETNFIEVQKRQRKNYRK